MLPRGTFVYQCSSFIFWRIWYGLLLSQTMPRNKWGWKTKQGASRRVLPSQGFIKLHLPGSFLFLPWCDRTCETHLSLRCGVLLRLLSRIKGSHLSVARTESTQCIVDHSMFLETLQDVIVPVPLAFLTVRKAVYMYRRGVVFTCNQTINLLVAGKEITF